MKRVICDTNIWYGFADGTLKIEDFKGVQLVATPLSILEIRYANPNNKSNYDYNFIQKVAQTILDYNNQIINDDPFIFIAKEVAVQSRYQYPVYLQNGVPTYKEIVEKMVTGEFNYIKTFFERLKNYKDDFQKKLNEKIERQQQIHKKDKKNQKNPVIYGNEWIENTLSTTYILHLLETNNKIDEFFNESLNGISEIKEIVKNVYSLHQKGNSQDFDKYMEYVFNNYNFDFTKINNMFNFYLKTLEVFIEKASTTIGMKIKENDTFDLLNLIYVLEDDMYFTMEPTWNNYIEKAGLSSQLYEIQK